MSTGTHHPDAAVVVPTCNRAATLDALLRALTMQTHPLDRFEVIVVDDGSRDDTPSVLASHLAADRLDLRTIRHDEPLGPASARETGWRAARADLIAFTDDDCEPAPGWLGAGIEAARRNPGAIIQGRTEPAPSQSRKIGPFSRSILVAGPDPGFQGCNVIYPRRLLEAVDGFDTESFARDPGAEDADLAWRVISRGGSHAFCGDALVYHAVNDLGPVGKLRVANRWSMAMAAYARHPALRQAHFKHRIFWKRTHWWLFLAVLSMLLPRRWRLARSWLLFPYARSVWGRARMGRSGLLLSPYFLLHDLIEVLAVVRGGIRHGRLFV